jgi:hypothetical protein
MGILQRGKIFLKADRNSYIHVNDSGQFEAVVAGTSVLTQSGPTTVALTVGAAVATTTLSAAFTGMWAFSSSTVAQTWRTRINQLRVDVSAIHAALVTKKLLAAS